MELTVAAIDDSRRTMRPSPARRIFSKIDTDRLPRRLCRTIVGNEDGHLSAAGVLAGTIVTKCETIRVGRNPMERSAPARRGWRDGADRDHRGRPAAPHLAPGGRRRGPPGLPGSRDPAVGAGGVAIHEIGRAHV